MDEAWLFIKNPTIREYVVSSMKTWRKHNAAMILATQSIRELEDSGMLDIVAESCPTKIFLANPEMNREVYGNAFHLNDTELDIIADLVPPGEMLIRKAQSSKKVRLNVDSVSYWIATNNARDNLKKRDYFARFGIAEGIRQLARDHPFHPHGSTPAKGTPTVPTSRPPALILATR
jgi:type IV secretion system protein VirB4